MKEIDVPALARQFATCDDDHLIWAEEAAIRNFKDRIDAWSATSAQVSTLLTLLLGGIGASLAFTVQCLLSESNRRLLGTGSAAVCLYLVLLAIVLVWTCFLSTESPTQGNEPMNLLVPGITLAQIRPGELATLQRRISWQAWLNERRAKRLDLLRLLTAATPIIFLIAASAS
jgi:hypothetical protein